MKYFNNIQGFGKVSILIKNLKIWDFLLDDKLRKLVAQS